MAIRDRAQYVLPLAMILCSCATLDEIGAVPPNAFRAEISKGLDLHMNRRAMLTEPRPLHPVRPSQPEPRPGTVHRGGFGGFWAKFAHGSPGAFAGATGRSGAVVNKELDQLGSGMTALGATSANHAAPVMPILNNKKLPPWARSAFLEALSNYRVGELNAGPGATSADQRKVLRALADESTKASALSSVSPKISQSGSAAYHIPHRMKLNEASEVELWIDLSGSVEQLRAELSKKLKVGLDKVGVRIKLGTEDSSDLSSVVGKENIWVGQHMMASLRGEGFKIEPEGARGKSLVAEGRARWNWAVTPLRDPGNGTLMLMLEASIDRGIDQDAFPSIQEYVEVELAPWWQRIPDLLAKANALLALFGLGLGAVVVYAYKWLRKHWNGEVPLPRLRI